MNLVSFLSSFQLHNILPSFAASSLSAHFFSFILLLTFSFSLALGYPHAYIFFTSIVTSHNLALSLVPAYPHAYIFSYNWPSHFLEASCPHDRYSWNLVYTFKDDWLYRAKSGEKSSQKKKTGVIVYGYRDTVTICRSPLPPCLAPYPHHRLDRL